MAQFLSRTSNALNALLSSILSKRQLSA